MRAQKKWMGLAAAVCGCCLLVGYAQSQQATQNRANRPEARNAGSPTAAADQYLAACLLAKNKAEIEISELALDKSQNEQVRQFAQMLIDDHRKAVQKLQPLATVTSRSVGQEGPATSQAVASQRDGAVNQLIGLENAIVKEVTNRVREKLQQESAAKFDECFLGFQIGCHTQMSAALGVIETQTSGQVQQLAESMKPTVDKHLQQAEELMQQTESGNEQASRTETGRAAR